VIEKDQGKNYGGSSGLRRTLARFASTRIRFPGPPPNICSYRLCSRPPPSQGGEPDASSGRSSIHHEQPAKRRAFQAWEPGAAPGWCTNFMAPWRNGICIIVVQCVYATLYRQSNRSSRQSLHICYGSFAFARHTSDWWQSWSCKTAHRSPWFRHQAFHRARA
jgi:hypothetical protein